jgi:PAS domain-containing protein
MVSTAPWLDIRTTLENLNIPSAIADHRGTITWVNDAGRRLFGELEGPT